MSDPTNRELLDHWRAEDQLIFVSNAEPGVCVACGTRGLVKTYRTLGVGSGPLRTLLWAAGARQYV